MTTTQSAPATYLHDGPENADIVLAFAHGAGAGMDSPFMQAVAEGLAAPASMWCGSSFPTWQLAVKPEPDVPPTANPRFAPAGRA